MDEQGPEGSSISKAFKEDGMRPGTKTAPLDKSEVHTQTVHAQTLEKRQQLGFSRQNSTMFKKANKLSGLTGAEIFIMVYYKGKHFVYISDQSLSWPERLPQVKDLLGNFLIYYY